MLCSEFQPGNDLFLGVSGVLITSTRKISFSLVLLVIFCVAPGCFVDIDIK